MAIKKILLEELDKSDKDEIQSMIDDSLDDFKSDLSKEIQKAIESNETEDTVREIVSKVFEEYHKVLWQRRGRWSGALK